MSSSASASRPANNGKSAISDASSMSVTPYSPVFGERTGARIIAHSTSVKNVAGLSGKAGVSGSNDWPSVRHRLRGLRRIVILVDVGVVRASDFKHASEASLDSAQRMVDQHELAGDFQLEINDCCATRRYGRGLHIFHRCGRQGSQIVYPVEDFADHVEGRGVVRTADPEENTDCLAGLGLERLLLGERKRGAVEHEIFGSLCQQLVIALG